MTDQVCGAGGGRHPAEAGKLDFIQFRKHLLKLHVGIVRFSNLVRVISLSTLFERIQLSGLQIHLSMACVQPVYSA